MTTHTDPRIRELLELAATEDLILPMDLPQILAIEDAGYALDLVTGNIAWNVDALRMAATAAAQQLVSDLHRKTR